MTPTTTNIQIKCLVADPVAIKQLCEKAAAACPTPWWDKGASFLPGLLSPGVVCENRVASIHLAGVRHLIETRGKTTLEEPYTGQRVGEASRDPGAWDYNQFPPITVAEERQVDHTPDFTHRVCTCGACSGSGEGQCPECKGAGILRCGRCRGTGQEQKYREIPYVDLCRSCGGTGYRNSSKCCSCNGSGRERKTRREEYFVPCISCSTTGRVRCRECAGDGQVDCPKCQGKKRMFVSVKYSQTLKWSAWKSEPTGLEVAFTTVLSGLGAAGTAETLAAKKQRWAALIKETVAPDFAEHQFMSFRGYQPQAWNSIAVEEDARNVFRLLARAESESASQKIHYLDYGIHRNVGLVCKINIDKAGTPIFASPALGLMEIIAGAPAQALEQKRRQFWLAMSNYQLVHLPYLAPARRPPVTKNRRATWPHWAALGARWLLCLGSLLSVVGIPIIYAIGRIERKAIEEQGLILPNGAYMAGQRGGSGGAKPGVIDDVFYVPEAVSKDLFNKKYRILGGAIVFTLVFGGAGIMQALTQKNLPNSSTAYVIASIFFNSGLAAYWGWIKHRKK